MPLLVRAPPTQNANQGVAALASMSLPDVVAVWTSSTLVHEASVVGRSRPVLADAKRQSVTQEALFRKHCDSNAGDLKAAEPETEAWPLLVQLKITN